jgi:hypothetical protein
VKRLKEGKYIQNIEEISSSRMTRGKKWECGIFERRVLMASTTFSLHDRGDDQLRKSNPGRSINVQWIEVTGMHAACGLLQKKKPSVYLPAAEAWFTHRYSRTHATSFLSNKDPLGSTQVKAAATYTY